MSTFNGFTQKDFDVFTISGLDERMEALRGNISPKLEAIANELAPTITALTGDEMFVHVAKHARRTKNPPNDTWAALANSKRGYKKLPHFQIGLWETHLFMWFAVIYESPIKADFAKILKTNESQIKSSIPNDYVWSTDHTKPAVIHHKEADLHSLFDRLENVKKAEILCGITIDRQDPILQDPTAFLSKCEQTFTTLNDLYQLTKKF
ncbi:uncharacterized protein YktB (UPF0637 family) [Salirhabdus euzebyi]|uniref:UPF0637 protein HNQ94_003468 n=1 Tax=Salirhabdus euzebyi TaxID=394506 RepID=A0A841Q9K0_9BACI|nr:DUF1054 domain-containing protein [Salirhabdus euzebyi]MBB6454974.1 uncharacterized protein YktB (UPF0637 family) [Salirhabdus euzebyi]